MSAAASLDSPRGDPRIPAQPSTEQQPAAEWKGYVIFIAESASTKKVNYTATIVFAIIALLCFTVLSAPACGILALLGAAITFPSKGRQELAEQKLMEYVKKKANGPMEDAEYEKETSSVYLIEKPPAKYFRIKAHDNVALVGMMSEKRHVFVAIVFDKTFKTAKWKANLDDKEIDLQRIQLDCNNPVDAKTIVKTFYKNIK